MPAHIATTATYGYTGVRVGCSFHYTEEEAWAEVRRLEALGKKAHLRWTKRRPKAAPPHPSETAQPIPDGEE